MIERFEIRSTFFAAAILMIVACVGLHAQPLISTTMPPIEVVGSGVVKRMSDNKNPSGLFLPPWKRVTVENVFGFKSKPRTGSRATFVPIDIDLDAFELNLTGAKIQNGCEKSSPKWWSAEFQPILDKRIIDVRPLSGRSEESPFDVVVIYPAVSSARQIARDQIKPEMLPLKVKLQTVKAAVDVSGDRSPDIIVTEFCCSDESASGDCDLTCGGTYKRSGKKWIRIDSSQPC